MKRELKPRHPWVEPMSRTVAALYDSRAEAEHARERLTSDLRPKSSRIISEDTGDSVDGLKIARTDAVAYREAVRRGGHLLVAEVSSSASPRRIIELLEQSVGERADERVDRQWGHKHIRAELVGNTASDQPDETSAGQGREPEVGSEVEPISKAPAEPTAASPPREEARIPVIEEEVRIGKRKVVGGGSRVRSFTREAPAEEQVSLKDEFVDVERRPAERQLTDIEVEAGGFFKERVFEVAEMREEPVITKVAVVREEVIVTRTVKERTETVHDTVRYTEVEVEDLPTSE